VTRFAGHNVIVTGGSSGIGSAIVDAFASEGASVLALGRDRSRLARLEAAHAPGRVSTLAVDVRQTGELIQGLDRHLSQSGGVDVLVNCAGVAFAESILEISAASWEETLATNLSAVFFASQWAIKQMVPQGRGAIVNIASTDSFVAESPAAHYCTSKAGVVMLTRCFAYEVGHLGIRVNAVAPGFTATPMTMGGGGPEDEAFFRDYMQRIPLRRPSLPAEQARVVLFLASSDASYINGETIVVDGGQLSGFWSQAPPDVATAEYADYVPESPEVSEDEHR
jgi:NAD(P)-dependent dehydrogenase (short-subunit alcohol dehydrogenase family)